MKNLNQPFHQFPTFYFIYFTVSDRGAGIAPAVEIVEDVGAALLADSRVGSVLWRKHS